MRGASSGGRSAPWPGQKDLFHRGNQKAAPRSQPRGREAGKDRGWDAWRRLCGEEAEMQVREPGKRPEWPEKSPSGPRGASDAWGTNKNRPP